MRAPSRPGMGGAWPVSRREVGTGVCRATLRAEGPYAGMNIAGVTGITEAQKAALKALGAVEVVASALSSPGWP